MKRMLFLSILVSLIVVAGVIFFTDNGKSAVVFYSERIRPILFSGLLTVGSFLLSLKVFIVVKFKENVFDSSAYKARFEQKKMLEPELRLYDPVRNLNRVIFLAIASSLLASVSQITLGLVAEWWAMLMCIAVAAFAGTMLFQVLNLVRSILKEWLDYMEDPPSTNKSEAGWRD